MKLSIKLIYIILLLVAFAGYAGCRNQNKPAEKQIVKNPEEIDEQVADNLKSVLQYAQGNNGQIDDSSNLVLTKIVSAFYENNGYHNLWSKKGTWLPMADSMIDFIEHARYYGLYPGDYHFNDIAALKEKFQGDSLARQDAIWQSLAYLLTRNESINLTAGHRLLYNEDSIKTWVANKSRKKIMLKIKFPLYINILPVKQKR